MSEKSTITTVLKEATEGILSEDALEDIESVFQESVNERASLHVEKALAEQDEDHSEKLEKLLEAIDTDHTNKLNKLVKAINTDHAKKLSHIAKKFNNTLNEDAGEFKDQLVNNISNYLELYVERAIPQEDINKAKSTLILEKKSAELPPSKRKYIFKVLGNKTPEFIEENYDYTLKLLEKTEEDRLTGFKKEAQDSREKIDRPTIKQTQVVTEETNTQSVSQDDGSDNILLSNYMEELQRT